MCTPAALMDRAGLPRPPLTLTSELLMRLFRLSCAHRSLLWTVRTCGGRR